MQNDTLPPPISIEPGEDRTYLYHIRPYQDIPALMDEAQLRIGKCLIVTDANVAPLYGARLTSILKDAGWTPKTVVIPAGESSKSYACLHAIYDEALAWGIDRKTPVIALGGGVVGDLAGFAASTLLRGIPLVQLPTTLIAQVDSALGGKTGINHTQGKNLIGAFYQPAFVCTDLSTIQTLPEREWTSGLAEVVKHALIADEAFLANLESNWDGILQKDMQVIPSMIHRAAAIKAEVVTHDEKEAGLRAILNFGHTFGHAIERMAGYGHYTHGEAVAIGMRMALHLSSALHPGLNRKRGDAIVKNIPIFNTRPALSPDALIDAMITDKKTLAGKLRFVLLDTIGHAYVEIHAPRVDTTNAIEEILADLVPTP